MQEALEPVDQFLQDHLSSLARVCAQILRVVKRFGLFPAHIQNGATSDLLNSSVTVFAVQLKKGRESCHGMEWTFSMIKEPLSVALRYQLTLAL